MLPGPRCQRVRRAGDDDAIDIVVGDGLVPHDQGVQRVASRDHRAEPDPGDLPLAQRLHELVGDEGVRLGGDLRAGRAGAGA